MARTISVKNSGNIAQVVRVRGGTVTIKPGKTVKVENLIPLTDERIAHFEDRGVTFGKRCLRNSAADRMAEAAAKAKLETAQSAVTEAEEGMAEAKTDAEKATAQTALDAAKAALSALQAG